jgi:ammonia channel protein AmtB
METKYTMLIKKPYIVFVIIAIISFTLWFFSIIGSNMLIDGITISSVTVSIVAVIASIMTWLMISWADTGKENKTRASQGISLIIGSLSGFILISSLVGWLGPMAAIVIGIFAGVSCYVVFSVKRQTPLQDTSVTQITLRWIAWYVIINIPFNYWFVSSIILHL